MNNELDLPPELLQILLLAMQRAQMQQRALGLDQGADLPVAPPSEQAYFHHGDPRFQNFPRPLRRR
jgi:hypothetical protein